MSRLPIVCDYPSALDFLLRQINYERTSAIPYGTGEFKLDRMRRLLALVGDPHFGLKAVHIAGTKGKGSTAAMIAGILQAAGLRTGLYTSPHLARIEERIVVDGRLCSEEEFSRLASDLERAVLQLADDPEFREAGGPTFFEITTAMAFLHFARAGVDVAVLEVGLGGRLDSTNVCRPEVSILTSISFDHTKQLGPTLAAIAGEKAGIIKPGVPAISGVRETEPQAVIRQAAARAGVELLERGSAFDARPLTGGTHSSNGSVAAQWTLGQFDYWEPAASPTWQLTKVELGMVGRHQADNAALAIAAARQLARRGWALDEAAIRRGLAAARCPARIEVVGSRPTVILDVAHNVASIEALVEVLRQQASAGRRILIFASSKDKDTAGMLRIIAPEFQEVILTQYVNNPRAVEVPTLEILAAEVAHERGLTKVNFHGAVDPPAAWQLARELAEEDDLVCITGSFFLAAELRPLILPCKLRDPNFTMFSPVCGLKPEN